ncbi:MAG: Uncharacterized protein PA2301, partial [uncultured Friedmanniella sp.]
PTSWSSARAPAGASSPSPVRCWRPCRRRRCSTGSGSRCPTRRRRCRRRPRPPAGPPTTATWAGASARPTSPTATAATWRTSRPTGAAT